MTLRVLHLTFSPTLNRYSLWDTEQQALDACTREGEDYRPRQLDETSNVLSPMQDPPSRDHVGMMMLGVLQSPAVTLDMPIAGGVSVRCAWLNRHAPEIARTAVVLARALYAYTPDGLAS